MNLASLGIQFFILSEFDCNCGKCDDANEMDYSFIRQLDKARSIAGIPFKINSGYRCSNKQEQLYQDGISSVKKSTHELGKAVDLRCRGSADRSQILKGLIRADFTRIGLGKSWIHVDKDLKKVHGVIWLY